MPIRKKRFQTARWIDIGKIWGCLERCKTNYIPQLFHPITGSAADNIRTEGWNFYGSLRTIFAVYKQQSRSHYQRTILPNLPYQQAPRQIPAGFRTCKMCRLRQKDPEVYYPGQRCLDLPDRPRCTSGKISGSSRVLLGPVNAEIKNA